jgi:drug/metabolite transporter (DMT)-like permease
LGYLALCLIWGSTWLAIRFVVRDVPPLEAAGIRFAIASIILLGLAWLQKREWPRGEGEWRATLVLSLTMMAIPFGLVFWAEQYVTSSMTAILFSASPLTISLFTPIFLHRKVPRRAVFAMVIAFAGIVDLFYTGLSTSARSLLGGAAVLAAMTIGAWSTVYAKRRLQNLNTVVSTGLQLFFGSIALGWASWALESRVHATWTGPAVAALAFLTVVGSCVAFVVYYWLLKHMQPYQLATASLVVPLIAVLEGSLIGHEPVYWRMASVIVIVLVSVGATLRAEALAGHEIEVLALRDKAE